MKGKEYTTIHNYITPLVSLYKINDIMFNSKKINKFMPPKTRERRTEGIRMKKFKNY